MKIEESGSECLLTFIQQEDCIWCGHFFLHSVGVEPALLTDICVERGEFYPFDFRSIWWAMFEGISKCCLIISKSKFNTTHAMEML